MVNALSYAQMAAKAAVEATYSGRCDVIEYVYRTDPVTRLSKKSEVVVLTEQPCRISYKFYNRQIKSAVSSDTVSEVRQCVKLFISPDITIKPGSKIIVTQNGVTTAYKKSGQPSLYFSHQEIMLDLFEELA